MISLVDMRPAWRRPAGAQQRRLPLWHKRLAEIIDLAKNLDDPIQHHRLHHSAMAAYLKKLFRHNPLVARKPLIRVTVVLLPPVTWPRALMPLPVLEDPPRVPRSRTPVAGSHTNAWGCARPRRCCIRSPGRWR